jgi:predicted nucleic acid-binding protein
VRVFFDPSALAKRYVDEAGTAQVLDWCDRAGELVLAVTAVPELISAFCRLRREGRISVSQYRKLKAELLADLADALICELTPEVVQRTVDLLESYPLRGMDAIHVAAALSSRVEVFVSADARQCAAARGAGLNVPALA